MSDNLNCRINAKLLPFSKGYNAKIQIIRDSLFIFSPLLFI